MRITQEVLSQAVSERGGFNQLPNGRAKKLKHSKASVRAKVEPPFRVNKRQYGLEKVRFRGLAKNIADVVTLFELLNLGITREVDGDGVSVPPEDSMRRDERCAVQLNCAKRQRTCGSMRLERLNATTLSRWSDLP